MKVQNSAKIEFISRSANEGFARSSAACFALTSEGSAVIVLYPPQPDMDKHSAAERASIIVLVLFMWSLLFSMSLIFECLSEILIFCCLKWTNRGFIEKTLDKT